MQSTNPGTQQSCGVMPQFTFVFSVTFSCVSVGTACTEYLIDERPCITLGTHAGSKNSLTWCPEKPSRIP